MLAAAGFALACAVLAPYAVMLLTALKPDAELRTTPPRVLPVTWHPGNVLDVLGDPAFADWLRVSVIVATASTAIVVLAAAPAAYYTARHRFPGRTAFLFVVLVTQMFSPTALVVGLYREFFELDLVNTYAALILTNAAFNLAFAAWNEYIVALTLMTAPERKPLTVGITSYVTAYVQHWNQLFAASVLAIVPVVILFALIERHLVGGLTAGSVK